MIYPTIAESIVESAALAWLESIGWHIVGGPDTSPERDDYGQVVLEARLREAVARLNPGLPPSALEDASRKLVRPEGSTLEARNRMFHRMLVSGVTVEYRTGDGAIRGAQAQAIDFSDPTANDWLAVNQFTVTENRNTRRPDVVLFVNGLPLAVIELKNPVAEDATVWTAWQQLQTYKAELPTLFCMNEALMVSDGTQARIGTLTAGREWFKPWRTVTGETLADPGLTELQVMLQGVCQPEAFPRPAPRLHRLRGRRRRFAGQEDGGLSPVSRGTDCPEGDCFVRWSCSRQRGRSQRPADAIMQEADRGGETGDRRIGVVWHTQGSGKSLTMAFLRWGHHS